MKGKNVTVHLDGDQIELLERVAKTTGKTKAKIMEESFKAFIDNNSDLFVDRNKVYEEAMEYLPSDEDDEETLRKKRSYLVSYLKKMKEAP